MTYTDKALLFNHAARQLRQVVDSLIDESGNMRVEAKALDQRQKTKPTDTLGIRGAASYNDGKLDRAVSIIMEAKQALHRIEETGQNEEAERIVDRERSMNDAG